MAPIRKPLQSTSPQPTLYVETLGGFRVHLHKRRLPGQGRASGRPLQLLALLIAMGGHEVPMVRLQEALWPESDGDRAHRAFATTLHRLRRLVGQETLRLRDGRLSLSSQRCRVDAFDFTALEETAALERLEAGLERYRGDFLEDMWELPACWPCASACACCF